MKRKMSAEVVAARKSLEGSIKQLADTSLNTVTGGRIPKTAP